MDISKIKLGKASIDEKDAFAVKTIPFAKYIDKITEPIPPANGGYITLVQNNVSVLGNDKWGDCVEAGALHMIQRFTAYAGTQVVPTTAEALNLYSILTGFNPNDPNTDQGTDPLALLNYWKSTGITCGGTVHKIVAFAAVNPKNKAEIDLAIYMFGGVFTGYALPVAAQNPITGLNGNPCWSNPGNVSGNNAPGSWGGHMVDKAGYGIDSQGNIGSMIDTWAEWYDTTYGFDAVYSDEMWVVVTQDWIEKDGVSPSGFDLATLQADLKLVQAA